MSNIYNLEPPTKGKVILHTNLGDLEIELWPKEAPKACRNFVQLCAEGYYDNTIFHRVIKDYIAQGGDPTGTGDGGESIYGEAFKDEFHSRLRFTRRGLVACANQNVPHSNGSQFFITLDKADWLNNRNTIFGRVVGDTVYNMLRFNDQPVDDNDRPLDPPVIREAEVVWNPFDDLAPRVDREARRAEQQAQRAAEESRKRSAGRTKNLSLLSFGEEAEQEEAAVVDRKAAKIRSAHDVLTEDERLAQERAIEEAELQRIAAERPAKRARDVGPGEGEGGGRAGGAEKALARAKAAVEQAAGRAAGRAEPDDAGGGGGGEEVEGQAGEADRAASAAFAASMRARVMAARVQAGDEPRARPDRDAGRSRSGDRDREGGRGGGGSGDEDEGGGGGGGAGPSSGKGPAGRDFLAERRAEMEAMRQEATTRTYGRVTGAAEVADADLLKPWQLSREKYKARKRAVGDREKETLARLSKFTAALRGGPATAASQPPADAAAPADSAAAARDGAAAAAPADASGGYSGKVRWDLDHRAYMPAAWRVDDYLEEDEAGEGAGGGGGRGGDSLAALRAHRFEAAKDRKDAMTRDMDNLDDYVVYDPLLEKGKGKWSAANQKEQKRQNEWAGRANM
ncbi:hypothetical protein PLESTB_000640900 [Pleodorina starrii]|uniref:PPIase cyclophilin-type domain-containing protein n=1 Tax=Pleodorina starrii TaxID=330485 RepID=A0A9W6BIT5_9CHLO|nr:hypothetical protein PLESTM_001302100 [Pleodorina starrii]GLC52540.1 hypothetical protein PLESTB_000640900 [Pleodorina starrii]GLC71540.1 hypothetical protein PLESTF_001133000 [Pleodorina starrii]